MRRTTLAVGACVCMLALVAAVMGQSPGVEPTHPKRVVAPAPVEPTMMPLMPFEVVPGSGPAVVPYPVPGQPPAAVRHPEYLERQRAADAEMAAIDRRINELLAKWKVAKSDSEREEIQKELRASLKGEFNARFVRHRREIEELETKVRELRRQLDLRDDKQDEIVDFRLQQLLRDAQGLGWGTESVTQPSSGLTRPGVTRSASAYTTSPAYAVPTSPAAKTEYPRPRRISLDSGTYLFIVEATLTSVPGPVMPQAEARQVTLVTDRDKIIIMKSAHDNNPIIGKRDGIEFTASVDEPPDKTSLKGTLTGDNELSGELTTVAKDGQVVIAKGTFKLIKLPAQIKLLESIGESTSVQPAQSQHEAQRIDVIRLARIDPQTAVLSINKLFSSGDPKQATTSGPQVDADPASKQLMIRGTDAQIVQIRELLGKLGEDLPPGGASKGGSTSGSTGSAHGMVSLESGTYDLTFEGIRPLVSVPYEAGKWQAHERVSVDLKNDNGKITIEMSAHDNNPIIGKIQGGAFTASVDEPRGTTTLKGTLTADNEVSGDVMREIKHQHVIMKGKFKLVKLKSNALTPIP